MLDLNLFTARENRIINKGELVGVHWNSHKNCYSILKMITRNATGLVLGYAQHVNLEDVSFKIEKSKQESVRKTGVKDRHAFVVGKIISFDPTTANERIVYNPHKMDSFSIVNKSGDFEELESVAIAYMSSEEDKPFVTFEGEYTLKVAN